MESDDRVTIVVKEEESEDEVFIVEEKLPRLQPRNSMAMVHDSSFYD